MLASLQESGGSQLAGCGAAGSIDVLVGHKHLFLASSFLMFCGLACSSCSGSGLNVFIKR